MILIVDVETTGLPGKASASSTTEGFKDLARYDSARIVQITMMLCDARLLNTIEFHDFIVRPEGFRIENAEFHGIDDTVALRDGHMFDDIICELRRMVKRATCIVAHNASFDMNVIKSELWRRNVTDVIDLLDTKKVVCTMLGMKKLVGAVGKYGIKYPSLAELYTYTFGTPLQNAHNSKYDVLNLHAIIKTLHDSKKMTFSKMKNLVLKPKPAKTPSAKTISPSKRVKHV